MNIGLESRKLADYVSNLGTFQIQQKSVKEEINHIGGLYTDIVLQSGLNYKSVVLPRVKHVLKIYPEARTVVALLLIVERFGLETILRWNHPTKLNRFSHLLEFSKYHNIDTCNDLRDFLKRSENRKKFLQLNGFGPKTLDYCLKLLNFDTVAVDRHISAFVRLAGIPHKDYQTVKLVVEFAADFLNISRSTMDYSIWIYMSQRNGKACS